MKSRLSLLFKCTPVAAAVISSQALCGGVDFFLKIDGIEGESVDSKHKGEIEVISFSFAVENSGYAGGVGGGVGRPSFGDLSVTAQLSKASPQLYLLCATGKHIKEVELTVRNGSLDHPEDFYTVTLDDVLVSGIQTVGDSATETLPFEVVTFSFSKVTWTYWPTKPDGTLGAPIIRWYDQEAGKSG